MEGAFHKDSYLSHHDPMTRGLLLSPLYYSSRRATYLVSGRTGIQTQIYVAPHALLKYLGKQKGKDWHLKRLNKVPL